MGDRLIESSLSLSHTISLSISALRFSAAVFTHRDGHIIIIITIVSGNNMPGNIRVHPVGLTRNNCGADKS